VHRAGSSYLLQTGEQTLLIDCGPGSVRRLLEAGIEITDIDHLLLTHLHYDHCVDYGYLTLTRWDQGVGQIDELQVIGPAPVQHMTDRLFATDGVYGPDLAAPNIQAVISSTSVEVVPCLASRPCLSWAKWSTGTRSTARDGG
jgi:ribonuclease BN (tRNA processing enzyme)